MMTCDVPLFTLENLGLTLRAKPVLRAVDWQWQPGEHWAIVGPNGAGKTALAGVLSGETQHFSGRYARGDTLKERGAAYVCFERARRLCERDRKLDCAEFESSAVDAGTRVRDLLPQDSAASERDRVLALLGLEQLLDRGLRYISTGEMRKTLLASAILSQRALLILDSPLDGLDRRMQSQLGEALEEIIEASTATLVLARGMTDVPRACTHVLLLDNGRIIERGSREAVFSGENYARLMSTPEIRLAPPPLPQRRSAPADAATATLALRNVRVDFGELCVFRNLNWTLRSDQHCLISGPNGSGKSTLLDLLTGDNHRAYGQDITLFGIRRGSGESVWDIKQRFGRVDARMQFSIPGGTTVLETVCSGFFDSLGLYDRPSDRQRAMAREWLAALGLQPRAREEFQSLSFGLQRLVLLARAMVKGPAILLLDEATLSLDAGHRALFLSAVDHVIAHSDTQLLFVSHSAGEAPACINQRLTFVPGPEGSKVIIEEG